MVRTALACVVLALCACALEGKAMRGHPRGVTVGDGNNLDLRDGTYTFGPGDKVEGPQGTNSAQAAYGLRANHGVPPGDSRDAADDAAYHRVMSKPVGERAAELAAIKAEFESTKTEAKAYVDPMMPAAVPAGEAKAVEAAPPAAPKKSKGKGKGKGKAKLGPDGKPCAVDDIKSQATGKKLSMFAGFWGMDRFYFGHMWWGLAKLCAGVFAVCFPLCHCVVLGFGVMPKFTDDGKPTGMCGRIVNLVPTAEGKKQWDQNVYAQGRCAGRLWCALTVGAYIAWLIYDALQFSNGSMVPAGGLHCLVE